MRIGILITAAALGAAAAFGQSFNIDLDAAAGIGAGAPAPAFGAAAGQAGVWNAVPTGSAGAVSLVDLAGSPTVVTLQRGSTMPFAFDHPLTTGNAGLLLDDYEDTSPGTTYVFTGLIPGTYRVYTYGWAPDNGSFRSNVSVPLSPEGPQCIGGPLPAANVFIPGVTHALHTATVNGLLEVTVDSCLSFVTVNGFQLVYCPDGFRFVIQQAAPGAVLQFNFTCGNPSWFYFAGLALTPGGFPNGPWFGIAFDQVLFDLVALAGPPLFGLLDADGNSFGPLISVPPGFPIFGVGITADPGVTVVGASTPFVYVTQ